MWWRLIVLVLSIVVIIIIIIQQFDDVNACQFSSDLRDFFSEHPLMDFPAQARKSANLHIQDGSYAPICIF